MMPHLVQTMRGPKAGTGTALQAAPCSAGGRESTIESGARFAIVVDDAVRTHRDTREAALEAANVLKALNPWIAIRDLQTGAQTDPQKP
jgi:hypothetical protein